uniref:Putative secreted protein n=1 Tax=Ixodes ricinus TaxID=34613 RepID=A0A6B0UEX5_IXORI
MCWTKSLASTFSAHSSQAILPSVSVAPEAPSGLAAACGPAPAAAAPGAPGPPLVVISIRSSSSSLRTGSDFFRRSRVCLRRPPPSVIERKMCSL